MKKTTTLIPYKKKSNFLKIENDNMYINDLKMLTNELDLEDIKYLRDKHNEKRELNQVSTLLKDYVEELKANYDKPHEMNKYLKYRSINLYSKGAKNSENFPNVKSKKTIGSNYENRVNFSIDDPLSIFKKKTTFKKIPSNFSNYKIKVIEPELDKKSIKSKQSKISKNSGISKNSMMSKNSKYGKNKKINNNINRNQTEKSKKKKYLQISELDKNKNNYQNDEEKNKNIKNLNSYISVSSKKSKATHFKKSNIEFIDNDSENGYDSDKNNELLIKQTNINNNNILKLNDLKKEIKNSIIGESLIKFKDNKKFIIDDSQNIINSSIIKNQVEDDENDDVKYKEERYRYLQKKGYVYDSLDDEEVIEDQVNLFYISPDSSYVLLKDFLICICAFFYIIYIPIFLGFNDFYCKNNFFIWDNIIELFIDIIYISDCIIPFFVAFYNFDEILNTDLTVIARHYMHHYFFWDLVAALPIKTLLTFSDRKCKNKTFMINPLFHNNLYYLFICLRMIKLYKVIYKNKFLESI